MGAQQGKDAMQPPLSPASHRGPPFNNSNQRDLIHMQPKIATIGLKNGHRSRSRDGGGGSFLDKNSTSIFLEHNGKQRRSPPIKPTHTQKPDFVILV